MNLNETIISSFFGHLILLLLMMAVSDYMTHVSGGVQNIVSVDLEKDDSYVPPATVPDSEESPPPDSSLPSDEQMSLPDQAAVKPPEESKQIPEPEKKAVSAPEPAKTEEAGRPAIPLGFTSLEAYHQFIVLHNKIFRQQAGDRVNELLGEAFKVNKREFYGGTAIVSLKFGPDGKLNEVLVDSASPELKAFLEEIGWSSIPAPAAYSLGDAGVRIEFTVLEGSMSYSIYAL